MLPRLGMLWWLTGCPYVFGPPDLSNVPKPGATGDTGTGVGTGTTGDTAAPTFPGPEIVGLQTLPFADGVKIYATFAPAGALDSGGALLVVAGGTTYEAGVPGDAALIGAELLVWTLPVTDPCLGIDLPDLAVSVRDSAGGLGPAFASPFSISGLGVRPETGADDDLGTLGFPLLWCGVIDNGSDSDRYHATFDRSAGAAFALSWPGQADLDLILFENGAFADAGQEVYADPPEVVYWPLSVGFPYELRVQYFGGDRQDPYMIVVTESVAP